MHYKKYLLSTLSVIFVGSILVTLGMPSAEKETDLIGNGIGSLFSAFAKRVERRLTIPVRDLQHLSKSKWNLLQIEKRCIHSQNGYFGNSTSIPANILYDYEQMIANGGRPFRHWRSNKIDSKTLRTYIYLSKFKRSEDMSTYAYVDYIDTGCPNGYHNDAVRMRPLRYVTFNFGFFKKKIVVSASRYSSVSYENPHFLKYWKDENQIYHYHREVTDPLMRRLISGGFSYNNWDGERRISQFSSNFDTLQKYYNMRIAIRGGVGRCSRSNCPIDMTFSTLKHPELHGCRTESQEIFLGHWNACGYYNPNNYVWHFNTEENRMRCLNRLGFTAIDQLPYVEGDPTQTSWLN